MESTTPAVAGLVLVKGDGDGTVQESLAKMYQSASAWCNMMQWSCPDTFNAGHRIVRHMTVPKEAHARVLMTLIRYMMSTRDRRLVLVPEHKVKIHGRSDSDYATNPTDHRSISSGRELWTIFQYCLGVRHKSL